MQGDATARSCGRDGPPATWVELALVDDPDAPRGTYVHWVLFGLDPSVSELEEGDMPAGARQAKNSAGDARYKGPCPPGDDDPHRYGFTVHALGKQLAADDGTGTGDALTAVRECAIAKGTLTGTFDR